MRTNDLGSGRGRQRRRREFGRGRDRDRGDARPAAMQQGRHEVGFLAFVCFLVVFCLVRRLFVFLGAAEIGSVSQLRRAQRCSSVAILWPDLSKGTSSMHERRRKHGETRRRVTLVSINGLQLAALNGAWLLQSPPTLNGSFDFWRRSYLTRSTSRCNYFCQSPVWRQLVST